MARFEEAKLQHRRFRVQHNTPKTFLLSYILLPFGIAYNAEWTKARKGDKIIFLDGGEYPIFCVRKLKMKDPLTDALCRMRYGITILGAMARWKTNVRLEGHLSKVISEDECLMVVFDDSKE